MKEIKFKAWDKTTNQMLYRFDLMNTEQFGASVFNLPQSDCNVELMQYTGLKDKNGKEIYQKDILGGIWEMSYIDWCNDCKQNQILNCSNECMACAGDVHWNEICEDKDLEVTGNVYQNPELLK